GVACFGRSLYEMEVIDVGRHHHGGVVCLCRCRDPVHRVAKVQWRQPQAAELKRLAVIASDMGCHRWLCECSHRFRYPGGAGRTEWSVAGSSDRATVTSW